MTSLFTNVPLDTTIDIILEKIYTENLITASIRREDLKSLLILCTKNVYFTFNDVIYVQTDGVAMGSPLGPVLANIFMIHLENSLIPTLSEKLTFWSRYVDDTIAFVKRNEVSNVLNLLNSFNNNIKFTYEEENDSCIAFLDVRLKRQNDGSLQTSVYRKETNTDVYIHWKSFAPDSWKIGTLRSLIQRTYTICLTKDAIKNELKHIKSIFSFLNGYPLKLINRIMDEEKRKIENTQDQVLVVTVDEDIVKPTMILPYKGDKGKNLVKRLQNSLNHYLPNQCQTTYCI